MRNKKKSLFIYGLFFLISLGYCVCFHAFLKAYAMSTFLAWPLKYHTIAMPCLYFSFACLCMQFVDEKYMAKWSIHIKKSILVLTSTAVAAVVLIFVLYGFSGISTPFIRMSAAHPYAFLLLGAIFSLSVKAYFD